MSRGSKQANGAIWSNASAFNLRLALRESQHWIEASTGEMFSTNDFHLAMKDGILLCKLANRIRPGTVRRIQPVHGPGPKLPKTDKRYSVAFDNAANSASKFAEIDNISNFIRACKQIGLKETLLFTAMDLHEGSTHGLRAVAITLYWLGRIAASDGWQGPRLNLSVFAELICCKCQQPISGSDYTVTLEKQYHKKCSDMADQGEEAAPGEPSAASIAAAEEENQKREKQAAKEAEEEREKQAAAEAEDREVRMAREKRQARAKRLEAAQKAKEEREAAAAARAKDERDARAQRLAAAKKAKEEQAARKAETEARAKAEREQAEEAERVAKREAGEAERRTAEREKEEEETRKEQELEEARREVERAMEAAERKAREADEARHEAEKRAEEAEQRAAEAERRAKETEELRQKEREEQAAKDAKGAQLLEQREIEIEERLRAESEAERAASETDSPSLKKRKGSDTVVKHKKTEGLIQKRKESSAARKRKKKSSSRTTDAKVRLKKEVEKEKRSTKEKKDQEKVKKKDKDKDKKKKGDDFLLAVSQPTTRTSPRLSPGRAGNQQTFYPNKEGFLFVSNSQTSKSKKWKKQFVKLEEAKVSIFSHRGGKLVRSLAPGSVTVAGLVEAESKKRKSYIILSSAPSTMLASPDGIDDLRTWSSAIVKSTSLHQQRSKRIINQARNDEVSTGFSREIGLAFTQSSAAQRLCSRPQKNVCGQCGKKAPTWTAKGSNGKLHLCLQCHEARELKGKKKKGTLKGAKLKSSGKQSLRTAEQMRVDETRSLNALEARFRLMQVEERQHKILGTSVAASDNNGRSANKNRIVASVRNSLSIRELLTQMGDDGSDTDDEVDLTFGDESDEEDLVPQFEFAAYDVADTDDSKGFSFEDLAKAYGDIESEVPAKASGGHESFHTEGGFLSPGPAGSRFSTTTALSKRASMRLSMGKFALDDEVETASDNRDVGDWNGRFQAIMGELTTHSPNTPESEQISANLALLGLAHDFLYSATAYGKIIISEVYLPDSEKTIKPVDMGGVAGGSKYIVHNILFKFALDTEGLYGKNDAAAAKVGGHELKGMQAHFHCNIPHLHLPLMALVDYRGFRVIAISLLPINNETIVYGTNDGGNTMHNKDKAMEKMMSRAAEILNLRPHKAGLSAASQETVYSAADIEGHVGTDRRRYLVDFSRTFPPEKPLPGVQGCNLTNLLRPELVKRYSKPLCSDAYSNFLDRSLLAEANTDINGATDLLLNEVIPQFAPRLAEQVLGHLEDIPSFRLTEALHRRGINLRHMGRLFSAITVPSVPDRLGRITSRALLLIEMMARVIKQDLRTRLRDRMKKKKLPLEDPYRKLVLDFLNLVFGNSSLSDEYWDTRLILSLEKTFAGVTKEDLKQWLPGAEKELQSAAAEEKMDLYLMELEESKGKKSKKNADRKRAEAAAAAAVAVAGNDPLAALGTMSGGVPRRTSTSFFKRMLRLLPGNADGWQILLSRVQAMMGLKFSPKCINELETSLAVKLAVEQPFVRTDLEEIGERIKYMNIMAQVEGYLLLVKGWQTKSQDSDSAMCYYDMAIKKFEEVLNSNTNSKVTLRNCAQALAAQEEESCCLANEPMEISRPRLARAKNYFQKAIEVDPTDPITFFQFATFLEQCELYGDAEEAYLHCLELDPNFVEALHGYGSLLQCRGQFSVAEQFFRRVMEYSDAQPSAPTLVVPQA